MIITTTPEIEGRPITRYCGVVMADNVVGISVLKDLEASVRDFVGGRVAGYERELAQARHRVLDSLVSRASEMGADAVVGLKLDYEVLGSGGTMLLVSGCATAVELG